MAGILVTVLNVMETLRLKRPDDWHIHLRDDTYLTRTVRDAARYFSRVLVMPNLVPPVTDVSAAVAYQQRILAQAPAGFQPLMTLYLTDATDADTVVAAKQSDIVEAFKLYPAGATTNSAFGVNTIETLYPLFEVMEAQNIVHYRFPGKRWFRLLTFLPFVLPSIVVVLAILEAHCYHGMLLLYG